MLDDKPRLEAVTERDIDILLMEEFESGCGFLEWFVSMTVRWPLEGFDVLGAWHSISTEVGESDLLVLSHRPGHERLALLIENKVDAPPQPEQSQRYLHRGEAGLRDGIWQTFATCIVAPQRYLSAAANAAGYQYRISYEDIAEWMRENLPPGRRTEFKRNLLVSAIEQQRRGYAPKFDPVMTRFYQEYWELSESLFPELRLPPVKGRPAGATWMQFRPAGLPKSCDLVHKAPEGYVDLQFARQGKRIAELEQINAAMLRDGLKFAPATKSAALRIEVPMMNLREDFSPQRDAALAALKAAYRLASVANLVRLE